MFLRSIRVQIILCVLVLTALTGCESLRYYAQAISGQVSLINKRQPIQQYLEDPGTPSKLKNKLELILELRDFAQNELHLPVKAHYLNFVELEHPYVLWNVYATPEFSFEPKTWCYPVAGCTAYRGYFAEKNAHLYAEKLRQQGLDVYVGGIQAYSTLGWFNDPVYSTFVYQSEARLAALIFHELAHQIVYVPDDSTFNESFATAVEQEGLRRWLAARNTPDAFKDYETDDQRRQKFIQLIITCRERLEALYAKDLPATQKRHSKSLIFEKLTQEYRLLKQQWGGYSGYDAWFEHQLNNAQLITVSIYYDLVPAFLNLLRTGGNDLPAFYSKIRELARKSKTERRDHLQQHQPSNLMIPTANQQ